MKRLLVQGSVLASVIVAMHVMHRALDGSDLPSPARLEETLPSPYATRLLSLGHYPIAADYYWLRSLDHFGDARLHEAKYPNLAPFLERAVALDPLFKSVYFVAGTALTLRGMDYRHSIRILEQGLEARPDVWKIPFYLGFNYYYFAHDFAAAAETLALAAQHPDAPDYTLGLATRLSAESQRPEVGLTLVGSILSTMTEDDPARTDYEERRSLLQLEVQLQKLQVAADVFAHKQGRNAESLEELVLAGLIPAIPQEPLGGRYHMVDGRVATTNESKRLRLSEAARTRLGEKIP